MGEPLYFKAYITNLGKYNEGELIGDWVEFPIDEDSFQQILTQIEIGPVYEEWFVTDYDCNLNGFDWQELGEYPSFEQLNNFGELLQSITNVEAVSNAYEVVGNLKEAIEDLNNGNINYYPGITSYKDWGHYIVDNFYEGVEFLDTDTLERYFDFEALGRELNFDNYGDNDELSAGEYWCGDEDASNTEIGEAYVNDLGIDGVESPENYFNYEEFGRLNANDCTFTSDGLIEQVG